eukprot:SAG31_NODE_116_length_24094_cov_38.884184_7_plen_111_part_00
MALVLEGVAPDVVASLQLRALGANGNCPAPIVLAGLLAHENQMTVMHMLVQRSMDYEDPIRSKDPARTHALLIENKFTRTQFVQAFRCYAFCTDGGACGIQEIFFETDLF